MAQQMILAAVAANSHRSDKIIVIACPFFLVAQQMLNLHLVPEESSQAGEPLQELGALGGLVCHEFQLRSEVLVVDGQPFRKKLVLCIHAFKLNFVLDVARTVVELSWQQIESG